MTTYSELVENPSSRLACLLVLDCSKSMTGEAIDELNNGVSALLNYLEEDDFAKHSVDLGIIRFGGYVETHRPFCNVTDTAYTPLEASGSTPMGEAVDLAITMMEERIDDYKTNGLSFYKPWVILITDGAPTDSFHSNAARLRDMAENKKIVVFGIGVGEHCKMEQLNKFCSGSMPAVMLKDVKFQEFFEWLSQSLQQVSKSAPGTAVTLPETEGWQLEI